MPRGKKKWAIWSLDERSGRWIQVDEGRAEEDAAAAVEGRKATAARLEMPAEYLALPHGQTPEPRAPKEAVPVGLPAALEFTHSQQPTTNPLTETLEALAKLSALINTLRLVRSNDTFVMEIVDKADEVFAPFMAKDQGGL